ncbi:MAG: NADH-quinone oxidoreductase subunit L [Candidatus Omnitrophota bacterium]|nr:MAG: NADH-quinone oxidoreductase subunit L [Candidatus Omnitrophota bacterium]
MHTYELLAWLILAFPLLAFVIQIFFGKRLPRQGDWVPVAAICCSLFFGLILFFMVIVGEHDPNFVFQVSYPWFSGGSLQFDWGFHIDNLTAVMILVVTVVSSVVHIYSLGYMQGEDFYDRFFAYLSLFSFSMLLLVLCDNLFILYISWELVGVSSYLLIGFYFWKHSAADACKKAFITTRVGDVFFFIGILMVVLYIGEFNYTKVFEAVAHGELTGWVLTIAVVCLFGGAVGKSAQFPLHVWLPDAMEGPTPVSALIHAATMVAAGVYMVGRLFPIFSASPAAMLVVAYIGLITAFFAATIAITQTDIKRVLAYSTVSQLGYMVTALGVGAYTAGLYHLMTHAFFKALLFLGSGSVIHAVHTNEMPSMGGLKKKMPITFWTMLIATLAISGVPFFSGFGSKDAILAASLEFGMTHWLHMPIFLGLLLGAGITAFYMFRLIFLTFFGEAREPKRYDHAHESPYSMTVPLMILAGLSVIGGFGLYGGLWFNHLVVPPVIGDAAHHAAEGHGAHGSALAHYGAMALSILFATGGILLSYLVYYKKKISAEAVAGRFPVLYNLSFHKYWVDELYGKTVIAFVMWFRMVLARFDNKVVDGIVNATAPALRGVSSFSGAWDKYVVDGLVNLIAIVVQAVGAVSTLIQSGVIQNYLMKVGIAVGAILLLHNFILRIF